MEQVQNISDRTLCMYCKTKFSSGIPFYVQVHSISTRLRNWYSMYWNSQRVFFHRIYLILMHEAAPQKSCKRRSPRAIFMIQMQRWHCPITFLFRFPVHCGSLFCILEYIVSKSLSPFRERYVLPQPLLNPMERVFGALDNI